MSIQFTDREAYLTEACGLILDEVVMPAVRLHGFGYDRPSVKVSCGFAPSTRSSNKVVAVCFKREVSTSGVNEVFVSPKIDAPLEVLGALAHELIHAVDDCASGHEGFFAKVARRIGLDGKLTATYPNAMLATRLQSIIDLLGDYPHARMELSNVKKQGTRLIKITCSNDECGWHARTSELMIQKMGRGDGDRHCPACQSGYLKV